MNVDHFGIVFTIVLILVVLAFTFVTTNNVIILPETTTSQNTAFADYCERLDLKC